MGLKSYSTTYYRLTCDGPGCYRETDEEDDEGRAERAAASQGWQQHRHRWYCPACVAKYMPDPTEQRLRETYALSELELQVLIAGDPAEVERMVRERPRLKWCVEELQATTGGR